MLDTACISPVTRIGTVVTEILARHGVAGPVAAEAELARLGLTSIDMVEVMLGVEAEFDVSIPPCDVKVCNFRSVSTIANLVTRLRSAVSESKSEV